MTTIEINGRTYQEGERGRFDAFLIQEGEAIAHTEYDRVIWYAGRREDVQVWAESFGINEIIER